MEGQSETRSDVLGGDWAGDTASVGVALREDLPGAGDVVSESVRAGQEEIWPLKGVDGVV